MLTKALGELLADKNVSPARFAQIVGRLLAFGTIVRDEDNTEARLYDEARRTEGVLTEYFGIGSFRLVHDLKNESFRLYAPGANIPGLPADDAEPVPALRARPSPDVIACILVLRFLYQQGLTEGGNRLTDKGEVLIRFEELAVALQTHLKRSLPETNTDKMRLLSDLRRHRVIHYSKNFTIADEDALIAIRSTILGLLDDSLLASAEPDTSDAPVDVMPAEDDPATEQTEQEV